MEEYALYRGDDLLYIGTVEELAKAHGVKKRTIIQYRTPSYEGVVAKRKNPDKCITLVSLDD